LTEIVNSDVIKEIESDPDFEKGLVGFLPPEHQSSYGFHETLHSAQFLQALESLDSLAQTGNYHSLLMNLGLNPNDVQSILNGSEALITAIMKKFPPKSG